MAGLVGNELWVVIVTVQLMDHPHTSEDHCAGVFNKTEEEMVQVIFDIGQVWSKERIAVRREKLVLNEVNRSRR